MPGPELPSLDDPNPQESIVLRPIRNDAHAVSRQWFHFRLSQARGIACTRRFENAGARTCPKDAHALRG